MKIIAVDPGTERSAMILWDGRKIHMARILSNPDTRDQIYGFGAPKPMLFIEQIECYGMVMGQTTLETVFWSGRFAEAAINCGIEVGRMVRRDIKLHHCGSMRAKDSNVRRALIDKYGPPGTKKKPGATYGLKADLWQAFALATYISETQKEVKP